MIHCYNVGELDVYGCVLYAKGTHSLCIDKSNHHSYHTEIAFRGTFKRVFPYSTYSLLLLSSHIIE